LLIIEYREQTQILLNKGQTVTALFSLC
jgi:hypothetical protein